MITGKIWGSSRLGSQIVSRGYFVPGRTGSEYTTGGFWPSRRPPALSSLSGHRHSEGNYDDEEDQKLLLPRPEELPPLEEHNDMLQAAIWLGVILVCLVLVIIFSRGFF